MATAVAIVFGRAMSSSRQADDGVVEAKGSRRTTQTQHLPHARSVGLRDVKMSRGCGAEPDAQCQARKPSTSNDTRNSSEAHTSVWIPTNNDTLLQLLGESCHLQQKRSKGVSGCRHGPSQTREGFGRAAATTGHSFEDVHAQTVPFSHTAQSVFRSIYISFALAPISKTSLNLP